MRMDKFLKASRIIKRRTVAREACDGGRVTLNGRPAKASSAVAPGDIVEVSFASRSVRYEVVCVEEASSRAQSAGMAREL